MDDKFEEIWKQSAERGPVDTDTLLNDNNNNSGITCVNENANDGILQLNSSLNSKKQ